MKKPKKNSIDILIEKLASEFSKIPNFNLTQEDADGNRLFNFVITKYSEINDFKTLYRRYFIPKTNEAVVDAKNAIKKSFYRKIIKVTESQLKENYYETIRLGYVGLFHKIENFVKGLLAECNEIYNNGETGSESIEMYFKKKFEFKFTDWYASYITHKINWICNCVKHNDGYPNKEKDFKYLNHLPENEKIQIGHDEFYSDIDLIADSFFQFKLTQILTLSLYKMMMDEHGDNLDQFDNDKLAEIEKNLEVLMKSYAP